MVKSDAVVINNRDGRYSAQAMGGGNCRKDKSRNVKGLSTHRSLDWYEQAFSVNRFYYVDAEGSYELNHEGPDDPV